APNVDRRDGSGRVASYPVHFQQALDGVRHVAVANLLRGAMKIARARVVAEPGPQPEHLVEWRSRQRAHRRKTRHPALPIRDHRLDARLLQHDLADPDGIGVARAAPGKVTL